MAHRSREQSRKHQNSVATHRTDGDEFDHATVDDDFWDHEINIDKLIGDPVVFDFDPQVAGIHPVRWDFAHQSESGTDSTQFFSTFPRQTLPESTISWKFLPQMTMPLSNNWNFPKMTSSASDINWQFADQCPKSTTIAWVFRNHAGDVGKIAWTFWNQIDMIVPPEWYFKKMSSDGTQSYWNFTKQMTTADGVKWTFPKQTLEQSLANKWIFVRQSLADSAVPWAFLHNLESCLPLSWTFEHQLDKQRRIIWSFAGQSTGPGSVRWAFQPTLAKEIHAATLKWDFKKTLDSGRPSSWSFQPQTANIHPIRWNMPSQTSDLAKKKGYEEIQQENQTFKNQYAAAYNQSQINNRATGAASKSGKKSKRK